MQRNMNTEAKRIFSALKHLNYSYEDCIGIAQLTAEINRLKKEKNAVILAHNYQTADIIFGVADFVGDSLYLSRMARESNAEIIVFCGVRFMAETAKMLSPQKKVLLPDLDAGCSLAEGITAKDVLKLRKENPGAPVVCYINSYAETKAESDAVCTSSNALKIVESFLQKKIIFVPDKYMAQNLQLQTEKKIIYSNAACMVHESFTAKQVLDYKKLFPDAKIIAHLECTPEVAGLADFVGSTSGMAPFIKKSTAKKFVVITECGMSDVLRVQFPDKEFITPCSACPYMKKITLEGVYKSLLKKEFKVTVNEKTRKNAMKALEQMIAIG
jgi:quinolinate synthase